jgi:hypothetical protein
VRTSITLEEKLQRSKGRLLRAAHELTLFSAGIATERQIAEGDRIIWRRTIEQAQSALDSYECALKRIEAARVESKVS